MNNKKELYRIGEAAAAFGVSAETLRCLDRNGTLKPDCVSDSGRRYYSKQLIDEWKPKFGGDELVGISEARRILGCSDSLTDRLISEGKLVSCGKSVSGRTMYNREDVEALRDSLPWNISKVAEYLDIEVKEVYALVKSGNLSPVSVDSRNRKYFSGEDIKSFASERPDAKND